MRPFLRYPLEFCVCFIFVELIHKAQWFNFDYKSKSPSSQTTHLYQTGESVLKTDKEPYDAIRDDVARDLFTKVRVLCWVMTAPQNHWKKARHVKNTWGKRCNILLFMSSEEDDRLPSVKVPSIEGYDTLWGKTREAFRYVWTQYRDQADWFLKADDDSFIIPENLRFFLSNYNTSDPLYFGHKFKAYIKNGYMQGGSGYVLSKEALRRFIEIGIEDSAKCDPTEAPEDVEMSRCLDNLECKGMDTRDSYGRDRFLPVHLDTHLMLGITDDTWFWEIHPSFYHIHKGFDCCSDTAIGFHQLEPREMYVYYYLIYRVSPYGFTDIRSVIQSKPHPPPDLKLQELPFSGPSAADLSWADGLKMREQHELTKFNQPELRNTEPSSNFT